MNSPPHRECLACGMPADTNSLHLDEIPPRLNCLKCDANIYLQHDGSCLTSDIAHQRETVAMAMDKLDQALLSAWEGYSKSVRLILGSGLIREEALGQLQYYQQCHYLLSYNADSPNYGAVLIQIRA